MTESRPSGGGTASRIDRFRRSWYRTYDGRNNNITSEENAYWGAVDIPLYRELPAAYASSDPKNALGGQSRPSPREISNVLVSEPITQFITRVLSTLVYQWGQFLDHEITLTPTGKTEYAPIALPDDEVIFTEDIPFTGASFGWLAASAVQSDNSSTSTLRSLMGRWCMVATPKEQAGTDHEQWKFENFFGRFNAVQYNGWRTGKPNWSNAPSMENDNGGTEKTFVAGDVRAAKTRCLLLFILYLWENIIEFVTAWWAGDTKMMILSIKWPANKWALWSQQSLTRNSCRPSALPAALRRI